MLRGTVYQERAKALPQHQDNLERAKADYSTSIGLPALADGLKAQETARKNLAQILAAEAKHKSGPPETSAQIPPSNSPNVAAPQNAAKALEACGQGCIWCETSTGVCKARINRDPPGTSPGTESLQGRILQWFVANFQTGVAVTIKWEWVVISVLAITAVAAWPWSMRILRASTAASKSETAIPSPTSLSAATPPGSVFANETSQGEPPSSPPRTLQEAQALPNALVTIGKVGLIGCVLWWFVFYAELLRANGRNVSEIIDGLQCLISNAGVCSFFTAAAGSFAYQPMFLWISAILLGIGLVIKNLTPSQNATGPLSAITREANHGDPPSLSSRTTTGSTLPPSRDAITNALVSIGTVGLVGSVVWWFIFYSEVNRAFGGNPSEMLKALQCLILNSGPCGFVTGMASAAGAYAYQPMLFWIGAILLGLGLVIKSSSRNPRP